MQVVGQGGSRHCMPFATTVNKKMVGQGGSVASLTQVNCPPAFCGGLLNELVSACIRFVHTKLSQFSWLEADYLREFCYLPTHGSLVHSRLERRLAQQRLAAQRQRQGQRLQALGRLCQVQGLVGVL